MSDLVVIVPYDVARLEGAWPELLIARRRALVRFVEQQLRLYAPEEAMADFLVSADGFQVQLVNVTDESLDSHGEGPRRDAHDTIHVLEGTGTLLMSRHLARRLPSGLDRNEGYGVIEEGFAVGCARQPGPGGVRSATGLGAVTGGGEGVYVGVLDSGYDPADGDHETIAAFFEFPSKTRSHYAPVDRYAGRHGTQVAGCIAGQSDGMAPNALIVMACALTSTRRGSPFGTAAQLVAGLDWLASTRFDATNPFRRGCDIFNLSLRFLTHRASEMADFEAILRSIRKKDRLIVWAAGEAGRTDDLTAPSNHPDDLCVGALDGSLNWLGSNRRDVALGKPEVCAPVDTTSLAAAVVTGLGARILGDNPGFGAADLKQAIVAKAQAPIVGLPPGLTSGRVQL